MVITPFSSTLNQFVTAVLLIGITLLIQPVNTNGFLIAASNANGTSVGESSDSELRKTVWEDMLPHTRSGNYYNEFWVYHVFLENDLQLHITFSLANFGRFKSAVSGGKLFVSNFNDKNYSVAREFDQDRMVIEEDQHKISLTSDSDIYFKGDLPNNHEVHFKATKGGVSYLVDLQFSDIHPGYTLGDGIFRVDGDDMGIFIHMPKASVRGTVAINEDTLSVSGTAYMDHTYQTDLSSKVVDKGFRHISHTENGFNSGYYLIPKDKSEHNVIGIGLKNNGSGTMLKKPYDIRILESSRVDGKTIPGEFEITYNSGEKQTFKRTHDFQSVSFLAEVGRLQRRIVRAVLGGEVVEYVGKGVINDQTPANYNFLIVH